MENVGGRRVIHCTGKGGIILLGIGETVCRKAIASMFRDCCEAERILHNFLACPHGLIHEGRSCERGEVDGGALVDVGDRELGRSAAYSIQETLGTRDEPPAATRTSMRKIVRHPQYERP